MITRLNLKSFTVFDELAIDFSPRINVIIGENGTGKTHLLKAAYGLCIGGFDYNNGANMGKEELATALTTKFLRLFMPIDGKVGKLRRHAASENAELSASFAPEGEINVAFHSNSKSFAIQERVPFVPYRNEPFFVPTKEVLSLVQGMSHDQHDQRTVELIFDDTYVDLSKQLLRPSAEDPESKIDPDPRVLSIVPPLVKLLGGRYHWENGGFCFQQGSYEDIPDRQHSRSAHGRFYQDSSILRFVPTSEPVYASSMTAEGHRKVGMLYRLLTNGALRPGVSGPLFWDEPESNLNPKLMRMLVECLLELSRNGQQIIIATHDYVLLKWFDLLINKDKDDQVRFHALSRDAASGGIKVESVDSYRRLAVNAIAATFTDLYDAEIDRSFGGQNK